jgi:predicted RNA-binding protein with PUA-like domain
MKLGERGFFYHSNVGKEVVGIVEVTRLSQQDSKTDDPRWDCVCFRPVAKLQRPVTLEMCKVQAGLEKMVLINNSRLSVQPVSADEWRIICELGGVAP